MSESKKTKAGKSPNIWDLAKVANIVGKVKLQNETCKVTLVLSLQVLGCYRTESLMYIIFDKLPLTIVAVSIFVFFFFFFKKAKTRKKDQVNT